MYAEVFRTCSVLKMVTNCLIVVIAMTIIIEEDKNKDVHTLVRTAIGKVTTVSACEDLIRTSIESSGVGGSSGSGGFITMSRGVLSGCGVGVLSLISGS